MDDEAPTRAMFPVRYAVTVRWADVDVYGHVNNAVHYELMDTAVNGWLTEATGTDVRRLPAVGWVVETRCRYLAQLHFPGSVEVGLGRFRLGRTSVAYHLALFGGPDTAAAVGRFVHVYVDPATSRPVPVPDVVRDAVATLPGFDPTVLV